MKVNPSDSESVADVMKRVSHAELLSHYMGIDSLPVLINSPLRDDDKHPSFFIYSPDGNKVLYKDYATGDNGDIYSLLKSVKHKTFAELIRTIASEKSFAKTSYTNRSSQDRKKFFKTTTNIQVKIREWKQHDVEYWQSYGISVKWLKYAEVYPISHKIIYKENQRYVFPAAKYAYVFVEHKENNISLKIYQPFNKTFKWVTSNNGSVVGLWTKIPKIGEKICICSSLKDALCLWANIGIPSIYVQSETTGLSNTAQEVLKHRFKHIYICFDNDEAGLVDGKNLSEKTGFKNVILPFFKGGKDISDAYKLFGKEWLLKNVKCLFENAE